MRCLITAVAAIAGLSVLGGCAAVPPTEPTVMALPPNGKNLTAFQQDDVQCRNYASTANTTAGQSDPQQRYDIAYTQCMYSRGNTVESLPPPYTDYAGLYPDFYGDGWGWPGFFGGDVFVFHHHDFHDHGEFHSHHGFR